MCGELAKKAVIAGSEIVFILLTDFELSHWKKNRAAPFSHFLANCNNVYVDLYQSRAESFDIIFSTVFANWTSRISYLHVYIPSDQPIFI